MQQYSIVTRISTALACIVTLAIGTMLVSYWLSDKAEHHAQAINVAGSLRVQTYRLGWLSQHASDEQLTAAINEMNQGWNAPVFERFKHDNQQIGDALKNAQLAWQEIQPLLLNRSLPSVDKKFTQQVTRLNKFVLAIQHDAENRVRELRMVQLIALFLTVSLALIIMHWLRVKVAQPLTELTRAARRIGQGDFTCRITPQQHDELGILAETINKMNDAVGYMYGNLEKRVEEQTHVLQQRNTTLTFLYKTAKTINEHVAEHIDFSIIIDELKSIIKLDDIELCLITEQGEKPYLQIQPDTSGLDPCLQKDCGNCMSEAKVRMSNKLAVYNYPLNRERQNYGALVIRTPCDLTLQAWQQQLLEAVADQLALALSLKNEEEQVRRMALMQERTVIARELHDSLAQALSYLKIQVTRLNKAISKEDKDTINDVSIELKQGLDAAYRQLRELLTTFRLKMDGSGLLSALQTTVKQLTEQSELTITLDYQLANVPLSPNEEIHLLQIIREASQNAVHHSQGSTLLIKVFQQENQAIELCIEDNGVGMDNHAAKLNHYGMAIMQERSKHLAGKLEIKPSLTTSGTGVYFHFVPQYLQQRKTA